MKSRMKPNPMMWVSMAVTLLILIAVLACVVIRVFV